VPEPVPPATRPPAAPDAALQAALDRVMTTYDLLAKPSAEQRAEAQTKVTDYLTTLCAAGETDMDRLTVCGLTYLRERDGSIDTVKAGFTGL